ncbi:DUF1905 domain-containing protein [bacterium]|nr:DUF1905 domain-containing protein [bacterium]
MPTIKFKTKLAKINDSTVVILDKESSQRLSSRGLVMVAGTINGHRFQTALEPDGKGGHWFMIEEAMRKTVGIKVGDTLDLELEQVKEWPEPSIPKDLQVALSASTEKAQITWKDITPMARWEWTRWINGTKNQDTRSKRITVALSKLNAGNRRPCCFNTRECTVQYVSNKGILLDPE